MDKYSFGVITVSDSCFNKTATDTSGAHLREEIKKVYHVDENDIKHDVIPDDCNKIEQTLIFYADVLNVNVIFTTGGTGFTKRDVTPEATRTVITKEAPQLALLMSLESLKNTKFAALSRAVCGIRDNALIINFPGSKKAVSECFAAISDIIPHAVQLITNDINNVKNTHAKVQNMMREISLKEPCENVIHSRHICPSKTNTGDTDDRNSPFVMWSIDDALSKIVSTVKIPYTFDFPVKSTVDVPPFRASIKDGYAVRSDSNKMLRKVIGFISAGDSLINKEMDIDDCYKINTGAPMPLHADAVVQIEDTKVILSENGIEKSIEILVQPTTGLDVRPIGTDLHAGEFLFDRRYPFGAAENAILASSGITNIDNLLPIIGIISTGDELVSPGETLKSGQIYDSNTTMIESLLKQFGFQANYKMVVKDTFISLMEAVQNLIMNKCQIIICTGGVSMGDKDFVKPMLNELKFKIEFGRVNVKPGKPMTFAHKENCYFFGLPGNPVSAFVTFNIFVLPGLRSSYYDKKHKCQLPLLSVEILNEKYELDPRPEFVRASIISQKGHLYAEITGNQASSRLKSLIDADVLLHLPGRTEAHPHIKKGTLLTASILHNNFISHYENYNFNV